MLKISNRYANKPFYFFCLIITTFFISATAYSQTINFDETWKEFLDNNKISNMSELAKPDKVYDQADYAKYLLMNTNSSFCQSMVDDAENLMAEVRDDGFRIYELRNGIAAIRHCRN